jgi:hypothetical protein
MESGKGKLVSFRFFEVLNKEESKLLLRKTTVSLSIYFLRNTVTIKNVHTLLDNSKGHFIHSKWRFVHLYLRKSKV